MFFFIATFAISLWLFWLTFKQSPRGHYAPALMSVTSVIQVFCSNLLLSLDADALVNNVKFRIYFQNVYDDYIYVCIYFQLIVLMAVAFMTVMVGMRPQASIKEFIARVPPRLPIYYAWVGLLLIGLYPFNDFLPSTFGYFLRLSLSIFVISPLIAGYFFFRSGTFFNTSWVLILLFFTAWSFTIGSRGHATLFLVSYFAGLWFGAPSSSLRRRLLIVCLIGLYPFTAVLGAIGTVRDGIGRISTAEITEDRLELFFKEFDKKGNRGESDGNFVKGVYRLINWANPAVIYLSPQTVEYRYFGSIPQELLSVFDISILSGKTPQEKRKDDIKNKLGTAAANDYGFLVTVTNSVEFGIIADAWSRLGALGLLILGFSMAAIVLWLEGLIIAARGRNPAFSLVIHFYFLSAVLIQFPWVPATYFTREILLNSAFIFIMTSVTNSTYGKRS